MIGIPVVYENLASIAFSSGSVASTSMRVTYLVTNEGSILYEFFNG